MEGLYLYYHNILLLKNLRQKEIVLIRKVVGIMGIKIVILKGMLSARCIALTKGNLLLLEFTNLPLSINHKLDNIAIKAMNVKQEFVLIMFVLI